MEDEVNVRGESAFVDMSSALMGDTEFNFVWYCQAMPKEHSMHCDGLRIVVRGE